MVPYQSAAEELRRQSELPSRVAKKAVGLGGAGLAARVLPFLSNLIPEGLAIKGLSKLDPRLGNFIDRTLSEGTSFKDTKDFIKEKLDSEESLKPAKSLFEQLLGGIDVETLDQEKKSHLAFLQSAAEKLEREGKGLEDPAFKKLAKRVKDVLAGKVGMVVGEAMAAGAQGSQQQKAAPIQQRMEALRQQQVPTGRTAEQAMYSSPSNQMQGQQGIGPGQQALMGILQKINATMGGK